MNDYNIGETLFLDCIHTMDRVMDCILSTSNFQSRKRPGTKVVNSLLSPSDPMMY